MDNKSNYIVVSGNIGAGKTTITKMISEVINYKPYYEILDENPYLDDFYINMNRWSFNLQIMFLAARVKQYREIINSNKPSILDRSIYEDYEIFAKNLNNLKILNDRDFKTYKYIFDSIVENIIPPKLMIYLSADIKTLKKQIHKRGRDFEKNISDDYLKNLNIKYNQWYEEYPYNKIKIDVSKIRFAEDFENFEFILSKVKNNCKI